MCRLHLRLVCHFDRSQGGRVRRLVAKGRPPVCAGVVSTVRVSFYDRGMTMLVDRVDIGRCQTGFCLFARRYMPCEESHAEHSGVDRGSLVGCRNDCRVSVRQTLHSTTILVTDLCVNVVSNIHERWRRGNWCRQPYVPIETSLLNSSIHHTSLSSWPD